jgi:hypothetical protein
MENIYQDLCIQMVVLNALKEEKHKKEEAISKAIQDTQENL